MLLVNRDLNYRGVLDAADSVVQLAKNVVLQPSLSVIRQMHAALPLPEQAASDDAAERGRRQHLRLRVPVQLLLQGEEFRGRRGGTRWRSAILWAPE